jgi:hypothetical protein
MADLGTRAEPLSEGAQAGKGKGEERVTVHLNQRNFLSLSLIGNE